MLPARVTHREALRPGLDGLKRTVDRVRAAITRGGKSPAVRRQAVQMTRYVAPHDYRGEIEAIFEGVLGICEPPYRKDPVNVELLRGAQAGGLSGGNDCDDMVIRAGSLLESLGHPVEVEVMGRERPTQPEKARFTHVRLRVWDGKAREWIPFDPVLRDPRRRPDAKLGDEAPAGVVARFPVLVQAKRQQVGELGNFLTDLQNIGKSLDITNPKNSLLRSAVSAIPIVGSTVVSTADSLAAVNKATGGGLTKAANQALGVKALPVSTTSVTTPALPDTVIAQVYQQAFGHAPTADRLATWRSWANANKATPASLAARMSLPLYDVPDQRMTVSASPIGTPTPVPTVTPSYPWTTGEKVAATVLGVGAAVGLGALVVHLVG